MSWNLASEQAAELGALILCLALGCRAMPSGPDTTQVLTTYELGDDALKERRGMLSELRKSDPTDGLTGRAEIVEITRERISIQAWIENSSRKPVTVVLDGFGLVAHLGPVEGLVYTGPPLQPPAPPAPHQLTVPARSRVHLKRDFRLRDYDYPEGSRAELHWSVSPATADRALAWGTIEISLP